MVWWGERTRAHQTALFLQQARYAVDAGGLDRLIQRHGRQNGGNPLGKHGLGRARWADQQNIVAAGAGHFQRALRGDLPPGTSLRSTAYRPASTGIWPVCTEMRWKDSGALIRSIACGNDRTEKTFTPSTTAASRALASGTTKIGDAPLARRQRRG
jgi:hypothetical protein